MCQHVCYGRVICTKKEKTQYVAKPRIVFSSSLTNMGRRIPTASVGFPTLEGGTGDVIFDQKNWPTETKYTKNGIAIDSTRRWVDTVRGLLSMGLCYSQPISITRNEAYLGS